MSIQFSKPEEEFGELSNFWPCDLIFEEKSYPSSEHLYQALKYLSPTASTINREYAEEIRKASTPFKAKILANQLCLNRYPWQKALTEVICDFQKKGVSIRDDWEKRKEEFMMQVLEIKFEQNNHCRQVLLSTANKELQELSDTDNYWALGRNGKGQNRLGFLLSKLRDSLIKSL